MQPSGVPFWGIVLFFLVLFVLSDVFLSKRKTTGNLLRFFRFGPGKNMSGSDVSGSDTPEESFASRHGKVQLTDLEGFVLMQFAKEGGKGLSRKRINASLHLSPAVFSETLEALSKKGMIRIALTSWLGIRCHLSTKGHDYLTEQGYIPRILGHTNRPFNP